jgi:hypothetical protein
MYFFFYFVKSGIPISLVAKSNLSFAFNLLKSKVVILDSYSIRPKDFNLEVNWFSILEFFVLQ